jgi:hypothetical protein
MRHIITSAQQTAAFFVHRYALKKDMGAHAFLVYKGDACVVCVAQSDPAAAVGFLAGRYDVLRTGGHWLLYIIEGLPDCGQVRYPHTLSNRDAPPFYQELLYRHPFVETEVHDPAATAACHAAARFFSLEQIVVLQAPLDQLPIVETWFLSLLQTDAPVFGPSEQRLLDALAARWRLTYAMKALLYRQCAAYKSRGGGVSAVLLPCLDTVCTSKKERTAALEQLRARLQ